MPHFDAILICGGGVRDGGALPEWAKARFDRALECPGAPFLIALSAGTPHRPPPLDERGFPITEAAAGARYLLARGVDPTRILIEAASYDTIGNAYFSRMLHVAPRAFSSALVITSEFHMPRAEAVFRWVYGLPDPGSDCRLEFAATPNRGIPDDTLRARLEKESTALAQFHAVQAGIGSLAAFHRWLFTVHELYSPRQSSDRPAVDTATY
jgi:hypothetical protein